MSRISAGFGTYLMVMALAGGANVLIAQETAVALRRVGRCRCIPRAGRMVRDREDSLRWGGLVEGRRAIVRRRNILRLRLRLILLRRR